MLNWTIAGISFVLILKFILLSLGIVLIALGMDRWHHGDIYTCKRDALCGLFSIFLYLILVFLSS